MKVKGYIYKGKPNKPHVLGEMTTSFIGATEKQKAEILAEDKPSNLVGYDTVTGWWIVMFDEPQTLEWFEDNYTNRLMMPIIVREVDINLN